MSRKILAVAAVLAAGLTAAGCFAAPAATPAPKSVRWYDTVYVNGPGTVRVTCGNASGTATHDYTFPTTEINQPGDLTPQLHDWYAINLGVWGEQGRDGGQTIYAPDWCQAVSLSGPARYGSTTYTNPPTFYEPTATSDTPVTQRFGATWANPYSDACCVTYYQEGFTVDFT